MTEHDIPDGWKISPLANLVGDGGIFTDGDWVETKDQDPSGDVRLTQLADVGDGSFRDRSDRFMTRERAAELRCTTLQKGDILIARMPEPLGRACLYPGSRRPAVTVVDVCILRTGSNGVNNRWLMWAINSPQVRQQINSHQTGTTRKRISRKNLGGIELAVPPLAEQIRIVEELEYQLSRLDAAELLIGKTASRARRLEVAISAITYGYRVPSGVTPSPSPTPAGTDDGSLPEIPPSWTWKRLEEIAEVVGGVTKDTKKQSDLSLPEVPYLRVANVQRGWLDLSEISSIRVPEKKARQLALQDGDVLLNEGGDRDKLGRGWIWEDQIPGAIHQNHVFRARIRDGAIHPKLLSWYANSSAQWFNVNGSQSVNLASISLSKVRKLPIPVPPLDEQGSIVERIEDHLSILDMANSLSRQAQQKTRTLRRALLRQAFSGKLVAQDPTDEPASALLKRIQHESSPRQFRRMAAGSDMPPPPASGEPLATAAQQEFLF